MRTMTRRRTRRCLEHLLKVSDIFALILIWKLIATVFSEKIAAQPYYDEDELNIASNSDDSDNDVLMVNKD